MSEPFLAEIRIWACNFAPRGWVFCDGQLMAISQNTALFSLLGTTFGGDGRTTFALPDMKGRAAMEWGSGPGLTTRIIGQQLGEQGVTLLTSEIPSHNHVISAADPGAGGGAAERSNTPTDQSWIGPSNPGSNYSTNAPDTHFAQQAIGQSGGSIPHLNMQPYEVLNFCIATEGIFPSRG
jgi:microcystin-dependent protein